MSCKWSADHTESKPHLGRTATGRKNAVASAKSVRDDPLLAFGPLPVG
jgi:hypothetical protein